MPLSPNHKSVLDSIKILRKIFYGGYIYMKGLSDIFRKKSNIRYSDLAIWPKNMAVDVTLPELLDKVCEKFSNHYVLKYSDLDYSRTYCEFRDEVNDFSRALLALGVTKGKHVALWTPNIPQWFITYWAVAAIGGVLITVNTSYQAKELEYLIKQSDTHTLITADGGKNSNFIQILNEVLPELKTCEKDKLKSNKFPCLKNVIICGKEKKGCWLWDDVMAMKDNVSMEDLHEITNSIHKDDICNLQYTSGTTGFPKGVMLSHYSIINNAKATGDLLNLTVEDRILIQLPMFHSFGIVCAMLGGITHGSMIAPILSFSPKKVLNCINKQKITCIHGVPTMFIAIMNHEDFNRTDFSYCRTGIMGGSTCPIEVVKKVRTKMNLSEICITYGLTEASPAITMTRITDSLRVRASTIGRPLYMIDCKISDPTTNKKLPFNKDGEILAKGYNIMKGYYKMPEETASIIDKEGWLHTGDLGRKTIGGNFKVTGRIKDMINYGGENIYPKEVEDVIYTNEKVMDVQVIGVPDEQYGEEIMACVIKKDISLTEEELREYIKKNVAKYKVPRYITFVEQFPVNTSGKVLKYQMRKDALKYINLEDAKNSSTANIAN